MAEEKKVDPRTVQLKRVRLSFADGLVEKKQATEDSTPKHSCNLVIEFDGPDEKARERAPENKAKCLPAIEAACDQQWGKKDRWKQIQEDSPKRIAFRKGERFKNDDGEVYKGYAGNFVISAAGPAAGKHRPKLFDRHRNELEASDPKFIENIERIFYSGVYADVWVSFYAGDKGGAGVFASIEAIRSWQEGEATAGGGMKVTRDMWDEAEDEDDAFSGGSSTGSTGGSTADEDDDGLG